MGEHIEVSKNRIFRLFCRKGLMKRKAAFVVTANPENFYARKEDAGDESGSYG